MASRGAKNLIFLSRSGAARPAAQEVIKGLESQGVNVRSLACDVSKKDILASVIEECTATLPPIKGCIQGSMVLSDVMLENVTYVDAPPPHPKFRGPGTSTA